nr:MAG TPA: hypothetical protein [Caudoviricetes sp.]
MGQVQRKLQLFGLRDSGDRLIYIGAAVPLYVVRHDAR